MQDDASFQQFAHPAFLQQTLGFRQFGRGIRAEQGLAAVSGREQNASCVKPLVRRKLHQVRDIVFAAAIVAGQAGQQAFRRPAPDEIQAGVDFMRVCPVQGGIVVLCFHNGPDAAFPVAYHAAVCARIGEFKGKKGKVAVSRFLHETGQKRGRKQGDVAVKHQQPIELGLSGHFGQSRHQGVSRAELFLLFDAEDARGVRAGRRQGGRRAFRFRTHKFGLMADERPYAGKAGKFCRFFQYQREHAFAQQRLQRLGAGGRHARSPACGKDQGSSCFLHSISS